MELRYFSWEAFRRTGDIEAYLLYKTASECSRDSGWRKEEEEDGHDQSTGAYNQTERLG